MAIGILAVIVASLLYGSDAAAQPLIAGGLTALPSTTAGPNLASNADFETLNGGLPVGWSGGAGWTADQLIFQSGAASYRRTTGAPTSSQRLQLQAGTYFLSAWIKTEDLGSGSTSGVRLTLDFRGGGINEWTPSAVISGTNDWQQYRVGPIVVETDRIADIRLENFNGAAGTAWFDDVRLEQVVASPVDVFLLYPNYRGMLFDDQPQTIQLDVTVTPPGGDFGRHGVSAVLTDEESGAVVAQQSVAAAAHLIVALDGAVMQAGRRYLATVSLVDLSTTPVTVVSTYPAYRLSKVAATARQSMNVSFDARNRVLLKGVPRFVLGVYDAGIGYSLLPAFWEDTLWSATGARRMNGLKINMYLNYHYGEAPNPQMAALMANLQQHGVMYLQTGNCYDRLPADPDFQINSPDPSYVQTFGAHAGSAGYYTIDECRAELQPGAFAQYLRLRELDPDSMTLASLFGDPELGLWRDSADILSTDPYPLFSAEPPAGYHLAQVADWTARTRVVVKNARPFMTVLQFFKFTSLGRFPTLPEMRNMAYMAIVEGAQGLWWWSLGTNALQAVCADWCAERVAHMDNLKSVVNELAALEPVLLADDVADALVANSNVAAIRTKVKMVDGKGYIVAYNYTGIPQTADFTWSTAPGTVTVHTEGRALAVSGPTFTDTFAPYQAHVYVIDTAAPEPLLNVAAQSNGGVASASSSYSTGYPPSGANDGDRKGANWASGGGWNDATAGVLPDWLQVTFNGPKTITAIDVFTVQDNYASPIEPTQTTTFSLYGIVAFEVQYWNGAAWSTVPGGSVSGNTNVWRRVSFAPLTTDRVRILVTGALASYSRIVEVEAWTGGPPAAPQNNPPAVTLTAPAAGASFPAPGNIAVTANATDSDGTVTKVEFFQGATKIGESLAPPYTVNWSNVPAGSYSLTARATDSGGAATTSSAVMITVSDGSAINVAAQAHGAVASASSTYSGSYPARGANDGDRKGLSWGNGGGWNDATASVQPDWLQISFNGPKTLTDIDVFTVQDNYASPVEPTATTSFTLYGITDFQVQYWTGTAWATVPGGTITGNTNVWRRITFAPLATDRIRVVVTGALHGYSRIVEVQAWSSGAQGTPMVTLTAPTAGSTFAAPANITLSASVVPSGGTVAKVEFFEGTTKIGEALAEPYAITWANVPTGTYNLTSKATYTDGTAATSGTNLITVSDGLVNVAAAANGGIASASSTYSTAYPFSAVNDGDRTGANWGSGGGWNDASANALPDSLQVNFNGPKTIRAVDVFTLQDNYAAPMEPTSSLTFSLYGVTDFEVQYWTGTAWATVPGGLITGNVNVWRRVAFSPLTTTAIRVVITGALASYSRVVELEAWGGN